MNRRISIDASSIGHIAALERRRRYLRQKLTEQRGSQSALEFDEVELVAIATAIDAIKDVEEATGLIDEMRGYLPPTRQDLDKKALRYLAR